MPGLQKTFDMANDNGGMEPLTETHPWEPFIPDGARILVMGTFPPQPKRWAMDFYYPNRTNDFWPMMALIFLGDRDALRLPGSKDFDPEAIRRLLREKKIALHDTGRKIRRLAGNASDKFLEIVEPVPLRGLLEMMPDCHTIATTGEKAAGVIASLTGTPLPRMGEMVTAPGYLSGAAHADPRPAGDTLEIWRMPSTSRAYPLPLEKKATYYRAMFHHAGIL